MHLVPNLEQPAKTEKMGDVNLPLEAFIALDWALLFLASIFVFIRIWQGRWGRVGQWSVAGIISDIFVICSYISAVTFIGINTWKNSLRIKHRGQPDLYYGVRMNLSAHLLKVLSPLLPLMEVIH